jgi:hypothetical protein
LKEAPASIVAEADKASAYLTGLARDYRGSVRTKEEHGHIILTVEVVTHPSPPGIIGWMIASPMDAFSQMVARIKLADEIRRDIAARLGDPSDPDNCQCHDCYQERSKGDPCSLTETSRLRYGTDGSS